MDLGGEWEPVQDEEPAILELEESRLDVEQDETTARTELRGELVTRLGDSISIKRRPKSHPGRSYKCYYTNACSLNNKMTEANALAEEKFDLIMFSETWFKEGSYTELDRTGTFLIRKIGT